MGRGIILFLLFLSACATTWVAPSDFVYKPISAAGYQIVTYQRMTDPAAPIRIYLEGDGNSFTGRGVPTSDPTPRGTLVRDLAAYDPSSNVVYMARPCQYIMSSACNQSDWTDGRFSKKIIDSVAAAIKDIAGTRPVILIGYSGGAMVSGLVINNNPDINIQRWITIAGVLNHAEWTEYFGDAPLARSLNLTHLPDVPQSHYIATGDRVVPNELSRKWVGGQELIPVPNSSHGNFPVKDFSFGLLTK